MRPEKASIVSDLAEKLNRSPFVLVTDYQRMKVDQFGDLRNRLAPAGAEAGAVVKRAGRVVGEVIERESAEGRKTNGGERIRNFCRAGASCAIGNRERLPYNENENCPSRWLSALIFRRLSEAANRRK